MKKLTSEETTEMGRYFHPAAQTVTKLPDAKSAKDKQQALIKQTDGTYKSYQIIDGEWHYFGTSTKV